MTTRRVSSEDLLLGVCDTNCGWQAVLPPVLCCGVRCVLTRVLGLAGDCRPQLGRRATLNWRGGGCGKHAVPRGCHPRQRDLHKCEHRSIPTGHKPADTRVDIRCNGCTCLRCALFQRGGEPLLVSPTPPTACGPLGFSNAQVLFWRRAHWAYRSDARGTCAKCCALHCCSTGLLHLKLVRMTCAAVQRSKQRSKQQKMKQREELQEPHKSN